MAHNKTTVTKNIVFFVFLFIFSGGITFSFILLRHNLIVITTPSMEPTLNIGDLAIKSTKDPAKINANENDGDILVLKGPQYFYQNGFDPLFWNNLPNNTIIVHRAIAKKSINNTWYFLTKGDNNLYPDGAYKILNSTRDSIILEINCSGGIYVPETEIVGIVAFKVPLIGYLNIYFKPIVVIFFILITIYVLLKAFNLKIKVEQNEVNKVVQIRQEFL